MKKFTRTLIQEEPWLGVISTIRRPYVWIHLGNTDLRQRYRDSAIGPWWICIQTGVTLASVGYVYSEVFRVAPSAYIPYLAIGLILWYSTAATLNESCNALIEGGPLLRQIRFPVPIILLRVLYRNFLVFLHNVPLIAIVLAVYGSPSIGQIIGAIFGFAIYMINLIWLSIALAILGLRFRDMPQILNSLLGLLMLVTPIFWDASLLPRPIALVEYNFFHHLISIVRAPLMGHSTAGASWAWAFGGALIGWALALLLYKRAYARIAYWI